MDNKAKRNLLNLPEDASVWWCSGCGKISASLPRSIKRNGVSVLSIFGGSMDCKGAIKTGTARECVALNP